jgi:FlaA1/EpsC-like NDP-sugar epimerase
MICIFSIVYANYLIADSHSLAIDNPVFWYIISTTAVLNCIFFSILKTYDGIIRFSDFQEALRSISAVFCSFISMLILNVILVILKIPPFISTSALFIYFFIGAFLIFGYRLLVKSLYNASLNEGNLTSVVICGAGLNASLFVKTIEQISNGAYKVKAFVDDDEKLIGKTIDSLKIYSYHNIADVLRSYNVKMLFFARQNVEVSVKNKVVDECLERHVKMMNIPPIHNWMEGHLNINQLQEVKIEELLNRPTIELRNENMVNELRHKRILITGAAGSIGSELARQIAAIYPSSLIVCDQTETGLYDLEYSLQKEFRLGNALQVFLGDVKDESAMNHLFSLYKPNIVFHAAAYKHVSMMENHPCEAIRNNVSGTKILADLSQVYDVERFLLISTDKAINPTNIMGASKRISEIYCHSLHNRMHPAGENDHPYVYQLHTNQTKNKKRTKFITTRFGNVLGSNGSVIPRFQQQIGNGGPVTVTHADIIRYFMTIPEACSLVLEAAIMGNGGEVFLFDMGEPVKILDLAKKMIRLSGQEPGKDIEIQFTGLRPGEKLFEELLNKHEEVIPTHHKKILIAKVIEYDFEKISASIHELMSLADMNNEEGVIKQIKHIVPEYSTTNPIYKIMIDENEKVMSHVLSSRV